MNFGEKIDRLVDPGVLLCHLRLGEYYRLQRQQRDFEELINFYIYIYIYV